MTSFASWPYRTKPEQSLPSGRTWLGRSCLGCGCQWDRWCQDLHHLEECQTAPLDDHHWFGLAFCAFSREIFGCQVLSTMRSFPQELGFSSLLLLHKQHGQISLWPRNVSTAYGLYFCKYLPLNVALSVLRGLATHVARQHQLLAALLRPELNGTSTAAET